MKTLRYFFEALLLYILFFIFKLLPVSVASGMGGWIGHTVGVRLAASRKALRHIEMALPDLNEAQRRQILHDMWDNLGRVVAEYPHLETISKDYVEIEDLGGAQALLDDKKGVVFFGAHLGNWEVNGAATLTQLKHAPVLTYREPNNPWSAKLLAKIRSLGGRIQGYPKSRESGRHLIKTLKNGGSIGILIDQKYNEGIESPFFSLPAMTNPAFVSLAQKFKCPLLPIRNQRLSGCRFKLTVYPEIPLFEKDGAPRAIEDVIADAHALLEAWIRETPDQWIWLHRRWKR